MSEHEAVRLFRDEEGYNCVQAVLKAFQKDCKVESASDSGP